MSIGHNIKKVRKRRKVTQEKLAKEIGLSRSYIGDLENSRYNPSTKTLEMLAQKLDVSTLYLSTGNDNFIDLSYGEGIGEIIDEMEKRNRESYKKNRKHADDFDFNELDNPVKKLDDAVTHKKNVIRNDKKMDWHDASFLRYLYLEIKDSDPSTFTKDEKQYLLGIIAILLSNSRDIDIKKLHNDILKSEPKKK